MRTFTPRPGTKSAVHILARPIPDISAFDAIVGSIRLQNPFGCSSYMSAGRNHPPVEVVREMYTAKFVYLNMAGKVIGTGQDRYDSVEGYDTGIAAVISNMANNASHRGKVKRVPAADLFSVLLKCNDPNGERYFLSITRNRVTVSSYEDEAIRKKVAEWSDNVPALA